MIDLGIVKPGATIYLPWASFAASTGAPAAMTNLAVGDILIYKDGSVTQRASTTGFTLLDTDGQDFDAQTGINGISIDLSSNADAGFYAAGSRYWVVIADVTIDSQTVRFVLATFTIGLPAAVLNTTIATLASQTSFTLTAGPAEDDALNGCAIYIHDVASAVQGGFAFVSDYTGASKTVTLLAGTTFTAAASDNVMVMPPTNIAAWNATRVPTEHTAGYPVATIKDGSGTGEIDTNAGAVVTVTNVTTVNGLAANTITAAAIATGAIDADAIADNAIDAGAIAADAITAAKIADGAIDAATFAAGAINAAAIAADAIGASELAADAVAEIADAVWDEAIAGHLGAGSTGEQLNAAGAAGDPWATALPGAYGAGTAGKIVGDNINATVSSRATQTSVDTIDDLLDTEIAAIKAETASIQTDTNDIQARLPAALTAGGNIKADSLAIDGSTDAADRLQQSAESIVKGIVDTGATTTSLPLKAVDPAASASSQFVGRVVIFLPSTASANLRGQATIITASSIAGGTASCTLTVDALTHAPAEDDVFVMV